MKRLFSFVTLLIIGFSSFAQYQNVMISDLFSPEEPSITMNPKNPDVLMAGANIRSYYFSDDGGQTWTRSDLVSNQNGVYGDPCLITDTAGNFFYIHLANPPSGNWIDRIVCQRYNMATHTWNDGSYMGLNGDKDQDKAWGVVDSATNTLYVTWTQFDKYGSGNSNDFSNIMFSKSTDNGETWSPALQINEVSGDCLDSDNTTEGAVPAVGPNGEVYVAWAGPAGIVFDRSADGGQTWLAHDVFVSDQPGGWDFNIPGIYRCNGLPITCCDISNSAYRGTIYVNWTDQRNGFDDTDVWLAKSVDGGNTWSSPIRVNDDTPGRQQFFSWMTVDGANGDLYIVFYDRRNYMDNHTDVYIARSTDGGDTFENIKISNTPFNPISSVFFGDYTNITAHNGLVHPIWTRADITNLSVWTANIDISEGLQEEKSSVSDFVYNYPNPFSESTTIDVSIATKETVSLSVCDVYGRTVVEIYHHKILERGHYSERFSASRFNLSSGIYYLNLHVGNKLLREKMLVGR